MQNEELIIQLLSKIADKVISIEAKLDALHPQVVLASASTAVPTTTPVGVYFLDPSIKIEGIKKVRELTGFGLKEAKTWVDKAERYGNGAQTAYLSELLPGDTIFDTRGRRKVADALMIIGFHLVY